MKILMLHGSRQSGELFRAKFQALEKLIQRAFGPNQPGSTELVYPTAPFPLESSSRASDLRDRYGAWTWFESESIDGPYPRLDEALVTIASILKNSGPFDGVIGFSQGAALASMVASLLEEDRKNAFTRFEAEGGIEYPTCFTDLNHPPMKFVVGFSGYAATCSDYRAFYDPAIRTPMLHFLGSMDSVVDEESSMRLVESCHDDGENRPMVVRHSGGHIVPGGKREMAVVVHFIKSNTS